MLEQIQYIMIAQYLLRKQRIDHVASHRMHIYEIAFEIFFEQGFCIRIFQSWMGYLISLISDAANSASAKEHELPNGVGDCIPCHANGEADVSLLVRVGIKDAEAIVGRCELNGTEVAHCWGDRISHWIRLVPLEPPAFKSAWD